MADSDLNQNGNVVVDPSMMGDSAFLGTESAQTGIDLETVGNTTVAQSQSTFNEDVFSQVTDVAPKKKALDEGENFNGYLRMFFVSMILLILSILVAAGFYSFNLYVKRAQLDNPTSKDQQYVVTYKEKFRQVKGWLGKDNRNLYQNPNMDGDIDNAKMSVNKIINANDIDLLDKKELLSGPVSKLVGDVHDRVSQIESLKQEIAKQRFLPEELGVLLADEQAMNTIQRSLNALEVIKFSTATKVFSYMNTALSTIAEMIRMNGKSAEIVGNLLSEINARGEKDLTSYVYMCYLNPYETSSDCSVIGDFDLYQKRIAKDGFFDDDKLALFKKVMNAIDQLLEKEDTALFSITFNGFNAQDQAITFDIEVYTNQADEKALMQQGKKNPNIFIITSIINLLKQSTFIIGADIDSKAVSVDTINLTQGGVTSVVNYSNKQFTVPIQKDSQREIFDYIDLVGLMKLLEQNQGVAQDFEEENDEIGMRDDPDLSASDLEEFEQVSEKVEQDDVTEIEDLLVDNEVGPEYFEETENEEFNTLDEEAENNENQITDLDEPIISEELEQTEKLDQSEQSETRESRRSRVDMATQESLE